MLKLIILRHGETEFNKAKKFQGWENTPLTENGLKQVEKAADRLKNEKIDELYTSPLTRCEILAKAISEAIEKAQGRHLEPIPDEDLMEVNVGIFSGMELTKIEEEYPKEYGQWISDAENLTFPGGESLKTTQERAVRFFHKMEKEKDGKTICIVSHGVWLRCLLAYLRQESISLMWQQPPQKNTAVNVITIRDNVYTIESAGDISHLETL